jgi:four helix bundle protein
MKPETVALRKRTHDFFVRVIAVCEALPNSPAARSIADQLLDSAGATDSNYRAACRARSRREFVAKIGVAAEEADESLGWLEALRAGKLATGNGIDALIQEADELTSIFVKSHKTAEHNEHITKRSTSASRRR